MTSPVAPLVALVGTSCVGKTTLLGALAEDPRIRVVPEAARDFFATHPEVTDRFGYDAQRRVQRRQLLRERGAVTVAPHLRSYECVVSDRSVLDAPTYLRALGDRTGASWLLANATNHVPLYHHVFLLDPDDVPYACDDVRTESPEDRARFHREFPVVLDEVGVSWGLLSGSHDERLRVVRDTVLPPTDGSLGR